MSDTLDVLKRNYAKVLTTIDEARNKSGRTGEPITVVAVTKYVGPETIDLLYDAGIREIGENRVQAAEAKKEAVRSPFRWHMIGHLQTNKATMAVALFDCIHSIDSLRLARETQRAAEKAGKRIPVFLQVNVSEETTKSGVKSSEETKELIDVVRNECPAIELVGLMTMAPHADTPEASRPVFRALRKIGKEMGIRAFSMGMSGDYAVAVEEGATHLRIGSALFEGISANG